MRAFIQTALVENFRSVSHVSLVSSNHFWADRFASTPLPVGFRAGWLVAPPVADDALDGFDYVHSCEDFVVLGL